MEKIWCIFNDNTKEILERFNSCTEAQKEAIKYILNDNWNVSIGTIDTIDLIINQRELEQKED